MKVDINNKSRTTVNEGQILALVDFFIKSYNPNTSELSIAIVGDKTMRRLNNEYRRIDKTTDILSFEGEDDFWGELIICYNQIKRQKHYFSKKAETELLFIIVHGMLHLLGYKDDNEKERAEMINKGSKILSKFLEQ